MKTLTSLLPMFLPLIQVTLQDCHLPDSDEAEDEETAIQRVMQQVALLPPTPSRPVLPLPRWSVLQQLSGLLHWPLFQGHMSGHSSALLAGVLYFLVS